MIISERKTRKGGTVPAFVVDDKYGWVTKRWNWTLKDKKSCYLVACMKKGKATALHTFLWGLEYGKGSIPAWPLRIDHKNRNPLDNRISNLRIATPQLNTRNQLKTGVSSKTGLPMGVCFNDSGSKSKPYQAQTRINGKLKSLGHYATSSEAHAAYLKKRDELIGQEEQRIRSAQTNRP